MIVLEKHLSFLFTVLISVFGGLLVYWALDYVLIPHTISIPLAIIISLLVIGLAGFYSKPVNPENNISDSTREKSEFAKSANGKTKRLAQETSLTSGSILLFIFIYAAALISCIFSNPDFGIYKSWEQISPSGIIQLAASIMLVFFLPGYALLLILPCARKLQALLKVILGYLFSMLITGLATFILAANFGAGSQIKDLLVSVYFVILGGLVVSLFFHNNGRIKLKNILGNVSSKTKFQGLSTNKPLQAINTAKYEILIFASLFALLIVSTYYTYGGITLGDQWFHQGRSILFTSGSWKELVISGLEAYYPPFQSALVAGLTSLSSVPIVNTYASFAFLNIIPIFCFYYFFSMWVPNRLRKANVLATSLFAIFSGFGWIYLISLAGTTGAITSEPSAIDTIYSIRSYILMPSNFVIASHPDFNTGLIYIGLPAGLVLLGLARQMLESKITYVVLVTMVSILGALSHDEFHFFIIIACVIPLLFNLKQRNHFYFALFVSLCITYIINLISTQDYYYHTEVLGYPLLSLSIFFVAVTWLLYFLIPYLGRVLGHSPKFFLSLVSESIKNFIKRDARTKWIVLVALISVIVIVYLSSFVIIAPLSLKDVDDEALQGIVPWYQYPMKLGLAGLLGLAFIISYIFKRYEKEVFIFGIIIVIALIASPYYDQHRFSKYVMLGMVGFGSLLIYKILEFRPRPWPVVNGIVLMVIITTGSLSTLLFVGYNSLAFQNHDYIHDLGRRNFPSNSELKLIQALKNGLDFDSNRYNVVSTPDEYNFYKGTILTKLSSFAGFPTDKLLQGRFVLNVTNLDSLYRLLDYTNTRFIIIPQDSITHKETKLSEAAMFALDTFPRYYEDANYVVLDVPPMARQSSTGSNTVGLVYNSKVNLISDRHLFNKTLLPYNNDTFDLKQMKVEETINNTQQGNLNQAQNSIVCSPAKSQGLTAWSKGLYDLDGSNMNYLETAFRIVDSHDNTGWSDAGLRWNAGDKQYYASVSKNGLELYQKALGNNSTGEEADKKLLYQNTEVPQAENIWYNLKIENLDDSINVYVGDTLKVKYPTLNNGIAKISSVGISCFNDTVEFAPLTVGNIPSVGDEGTGETKENYEHNYPLSMLALSKSQYDTFMEQDLSALSKKVIVLSFDPLDWDDDRFNHYLQYVNQGGTLLVIKSDNLNGRFSHLFSLRDNANADETKIKFTNIMGANNETMDISGMVKNISINQSANTSIVGWYANINEFNNRANHTVDVPFAFEKLYSNGGKIILVNAGGYFDAISKSPDQYFTSLSNISSILGLGPPQVPNTNNSFTTLPIEQFVVRMDISGNVKLKSNSLQLDSYRQNDERYHGSFKNSSITAQGIRIYEDNKLNSSFSDVILRDLRLIGDYDVVVNSKDLKLPDMTSQYDYFGLSMPVFNLTINLSNTPLSSAQIVIENQKNQTLTGVTKINVDGGSTIKFDNIKSMLTSTDLEANSISTPTPILLKSPDIEIDGKARFSMLQFWWNYLENIKSDVPGLKTNLKFIDDYVKPDGNGTKAEYITFVNNTITQ